MDLENVSRQKTNDALGHAAALLRSGLRNKRNVCSARDRKADPEASEKGMTLVEMAVTLPVLFAFLFCFMELSLAFYSYNMISETAREGTRYAMVHGASCPTSGNPTCEATAAQVDTYVLGIGWANLAGGTMTVCVYYNNNTCNTNPSGSEAVGNPVKVTVTYVFPITMLFVPTNSLTMKSTSQMTIIQ